MIALLQRVSRAYIEINQQRTAEIGPGLVVLIGIEKDDEQTQANRLLERLLAYRIFEDNAGKMNLSLRETRGDLLLIPQFTLAADTHKGMRPSFTTAASPEKSEPLFNHLITKAKALYDNVSCGYFGTDMQVTLTNNGPVTFWLQV